MSFANWLIAMAASFGSAWLIAFIFETIFQKYFESKK